MRHVVLVLLVTAACAIVGACAPGQPAALPGDLGSTGDRGSRSDGGLDGADGGSTPDARGPDAVGRDPNAGIWDIFGDASDYTDYPYIKGHLATLNWDQLEPKEGTFDFTALDARIKKTLAQGKRVGLMVYHGRNVPDWIYDHVDKIVTDRQGDSVYPNYVDPDYAFYLYRMIDKVASHLASWPDPAQKALIGYVQCPVGKSGDENGWDGSVVQGQVITAAEWKEWTRKTLQHYAKAYQGTGIRVLFNLASGAKAANLNGGYQETIDDFNFALSIFPGAALKQGRPAHRHEMPLEQYQTEFALEYLRPRGVFTRGEMDAYFVGPYAVADEYVTNMYWNGLWTLVVGIDQWNIQPRKYTLARSKSLELGFAFVNKYAGHDRGDRSPGAWIALRDGLDAADTQRFPVATYGAYAAGASGLAQQTAANDSRFKKILAAFAPFGARQDDPQNQYAAQVDFYAAGAPKGWNDVKYSIYSTKTHMRGSGNYESFMTMVDPLGTSQGRWRVGPRTHPNHRWAREFNAARDAMRFRLDPAFAASLAGPVTVTVRYLDQGTGRWRLVYDATAGASKTAVTVTNADSGTWREVAVKLTDGGFERKGPRSSDLGLEHVDGGNTVFHMIEVER